MRFRIPIDREKIVEFCGHHHIYRLALFGSVLRGYFRPGSSVDVLAEFEPGHAVGLIRWAGILHEGSKIMWHRIDVRTPADLSRHTRKKVLESAELQYAEG